MNGKPLTNLNFESLVDEIVSTYQDDSGINFIDVRNLPVREKIINMLDLLLELLFLYFQAMHLFVYLFLIPA